MMPDFQFRITKIDHDAYCGREFHPDDHMVGELVTVITMSSIAYDAEGESPNVCGDLEDLEPEGRRQWIANNLTESAKEQAEGGLLRLWRCIRPNGDLVDLVDHEVQLIMELPGEPVLEMLKPGDVDPRD